MNNPKKLSLFQDLVGFGKTFGLILLFSLVFSGTAFADRIPLFVVPEGSLFGGLGGPEDPLPLKADLRTGTLPNGLRYYILENSLPADRAYLTLAVNAGSLQENDDERGLAHFVEHMAFNGTQRFPGAELINYLRSLGMRFGPEVNAYTGYEKTVYGIETPVETDDYGIKRIPERALAIIDDWTHTVTLNPEDVDKERSVIMEEYRTRLGARERVRQQILPVIFRGSRYADRYVIGLPEIIQTAPAERLASYYKSWYRPDNMAIILVGDFDGELLEKDLAAHFTAPLPDTPLDHPYFELPDPQKGLITTAIITDDELSSSLVYLYYKRSPSPWPANLRTYREFLINYLIETMIDFRFEEKIATGNTPYMGTGAWNERYGRHSRYFTLAANAKAGRSRETLEELLLEKERLLRYGFSRSELERAKGALLSDLEMMAAEKDRQESEQYINELTSDFLQEQSALDYDWENDAIRRLLPGIGLVVVNSAIKDFFAEDDITVIITVPEKEAAELPNEAAIIGMINESRSVVITPLTEQTLVLDFLNEAVLPGTVVTAEQDESGAEIWELSNGMRLVLISTANKNNELDFYALARGGTVEAGIIREDSLFGGLGFSQEEIFYSAKLSAEIQNASGLASLSKPELMNFLSDKQLSLSFWAGAHTRGFRGSSSLKDLSVLFQLLHGFFTQPRIDQNGFALVLDNYRTRLIQEEDNPEAFFFKELSRLTYSDHPLFKTLELADLDYVNEKAALAFLTLALNPADYTFVFAGSLGDREMLRQLAETWLASIPNMSLPRWNNWIDPELLRPGKTEKIVYKGKEEKSIVYMGWFVPKTWTEEDNGAVLVLDDYLDIVLTDKIREELGGVYSISVRVSFSPAPVGELSLEIYFICDPKRETELREAVQEQLASLLTAIDEETFIKAKEALVMNFLRSMENNGFIARNLANFSVITGMPLFHLTERPGLYRAVTTEQIRSIMTELFAGGPVELVLMPDFADN